MWNRHSTTRPDYAFTRNWIFESEDFLQMAFIIGVASKLHLFPFHVCSGRDSSVPYESADCGLLDANKMLLEPYKSRWETFLLYDMPEIFEADSFTRAHYMEICDFIQKMQEFAADYAEVAPHHIQEAEEKAPKETWKSPISLQELRDRDFERRWRLWRGL
jgi:hypothetical protein